MQHTQRLAILHIIYDFQHNKYSEVVNVQPEYDDEMEYDDMKNENEITFDNVSNVNNVSNANDQAPVITNTYRRQRDSSHKYDKSQTNTQTQTQTQTHTQTSTNRTNYNESRLNNYNYNNSNYNNAYASSRYIGSSHRREHAHEHVSFTNPCSNALDFGIVARQIMLERWERQQALQRQMELQI